MKYKNYYFDEVRQQSDETPIVKTASYRGITLKTLVLLVIAALSALITFISLWTNRGSSFILGLLLVSGIIEFITVIIGRSNPRASKVCGIIYSLVEGVFVGTLSLVAEVYLQYSGIVVTAVAVTFVMCFVMLALFNSGIIRNKSKFYTFVLAFGISLVCASIVTMIISFFVSFTNVGFIIGLEALFLLYGCLMLMLNFYEAQTVVQRGMDESFEWSVAFGLSFTVLYIYVEVLRILIILYDRRN